jgi:hypothetical protein
MAKKRPDTSFAFGANVRPRGKSRTRGGSREGRSAAARRRRYAKGG